MRVKRRSGHTRRAVTPCQNAAAVMLPRPCPRCRKVRCSPARCLHRCRPEPTPPRLSASPVVSPARPDSGSQPFDTRRLPGAHHRGVASLPHIRPSDKAAEPRDGRDPVQRRRKSAPRDRHPREYRRDHEGLSVLTRLTNPTPEHPFKLFHLAYLRADAPSSEGRPGASILGLVRSLNAVGERSAYYTKMRLCSSWSPPSLFTHFAVRSRR
jgi:hypothetical protein